MNDSHIIAHDFSKGLKVCDLRDNTYKRIKKTRGLP